MPKNPTVNIEIEGYDNTLVFPIIYDDKNHWGAGFKALITALIKKIDQIKEITFIAPEYLQRHYDKTHSSKTRIDNSGWYKRHKTQIDKLPTDKVNLLTWKDIIESGNYRTYYRRLEELMYGREPTTATELNSDSDSEDEQKLDTKKQSTCKPDEEFRKLVETHAKTFAHKKSIKKAIRYSLDEGAGFLSMIGIVYYPGTLNPVLSYLFAKFKPPELFYKSYKIKPDQNNPQQHSSAEMNYPSNRPMLSELFATRVDPLCQLPLATQKALIREFNQFLVQFVRSYIASPEPHGNTDNRELILAAFIARLQSANLPQETLLMYYKDINCQCSKSELKEAVQSDFRP